MKRIRRKLGVLMMVLALIVMQLPVENAQAAISGAFVMEGATLVAYRGNDKSVSVPADTTVIGSSAFEENLTMEKVSFPKTLRRIKPYAFWGCDGLKEIQFGSGLKEIGDYAFTSCKGLTEIQIPKNITSIGIRAFADCTALKTITIPETVVSIHETAFDGCKNLVIDCPEGSYADKYARNFYRRQALMEEYDGSDEPQTTTEIIEPVTSETEEQGDVDEDTGLEGVLSETTIVGNQAVFLLDIHSPTVYQGVISQDETSDEEISYPVKYRIVGDEIADQAYYKDASLDKIVIPEGIRRVGELAFARAKATALVLPNSVEQISYGAFYHCDALRQVSLSDAVRKVEPKAFAHTGWVRDFKENDGLGDFLISGGVLVSYKGTEKEVTIPDSTRVISAECFQGHVEIQKVVFPESLTDIGEAAFEGCEDLSILEWENGVLTVGDRAFASCALTEVTIPKTVKQIGLGAFDKNTKITYDGNTPEKTYESSAQRLANEAYRFAEGAERESDPSAEGVLVLGMTGAKASLSNAKRSYTLTFSKKVDEESRQTARDACLRNIGKKLHENNVQLCLAFTDDSGILIKRLGKESLSIYMPVPEGLEGERINGYRFDGNGQLEPMTVRYVKSGEQVMLALETDLVTDLILEDAGEKLSEESVEIQDTEIANIILHEQSRAMTTEESKVREINPFMVMKWSVGGILLLAGLFLALSKVK